MIIIKKTRYCPRCPTICNIYTAIFIPVGGVALQAEGLVPERVGQHGDTGVDRLVLVEGRRDRLIQGPLDWEWGGVEEW